jgi:preprotein translocase subunit SecA
VEIEGEEGAGPPVLEPGPSYAASGSATAAGNVSYSGGAAAGAGAIAAAAGVAAEANGHDEVSVPVVQQRQVDEHDTIGRNDPCWCGSGKKFKKCHGA